MCKILRALLVLMIAAGASGAEEGSPPSWEDPPAGSGVRSWIRTAGFAPRACQTTPRVYVLRMQYRSSKFAAPREVTSATLAKKLPGDGAVAFPMGHYISKERAMKDASDYGWSWDSHRPHCCRPPSS